MEKILEKSGKFVSQKKWEPWFIVALVYGFIGDNVYQFDLICSRFPLRLEKWESIFQSGKSQGILNILEKSGNFTKNTGKVREF